MRVSCTVELTEERRRIAARHNVDANKLWSEWAQTLPVDGLARYLLTDTQLDVEFAIYCERRANE